LVSRRRPWHQALTVEHAARFYLAHGQGHTGHQLLAQARQAYAAWGATAKVAHLDWAYPTLRPAPDTSTEPGIDERADRSATSVTSGTIDLLGILGLSDRVRNGYQEIRISFRLEGDDPEKLREVVEQSRLRSAVYDVLTNGVPVSLHIVA
jgi:hypothetical protein